ncbi:TonB-dependent receptor [Altibacter sp. HG106]|uniref:TonB-dependent receptor n=1 Tax=Altibacter sp. HG106 TaxID=3023937 RepID=UPI002350D4C0|nr:TonB-dependent receptor [Altibacter sp. HG106]MDC7994093.1 TonB-dependent receptor [Altibacter sp. HG106]
MTGFFTLQAQEVRLEGIILDTLKQPLHNANILAIPSSEDGQIKFSISSIEGVYRLELIKGVRYSVEVSYLGYESFKDSISLQEDTSKNIVLIPNGITLEEIILTERIPVKVREDTITYRPEKFLTGEERKLRDILKKLPGLEVDREGNVTVNGKDVTKLLVEGNEFFTGDEKMGVNNIPADVVDEIEALDNYNEITFLKGLSDSEELALNIKLKEGKKKFVFGELEAGVGIEDRYVIHPTLFYYSPKTSINAIGDINNVGEKAFTTQDYINFEGGFSRLGEDPQAYFKLFNDEFAQFLSQRDFIFNRNKFGAVSLNQNIAKNVDFSGYSIVSIGDVSAQRENDLTYLNNHIIKENRTTNLNNEKNFTLNKATLHYLNTRSLDVRYDAFLKTSSGRSLTNINSQTSGDSTFVSQNNRLVSLDFTQKISANKKFSREHTTSFNASYKYRKSDASNRWDFNTPIFSAIIPLDTLSETIRLQQQRDNLFREFKGNLKHYWVLHPFHHIYPEIGINRIDQAYRTFDGQEVDETILSFRESGFNNDLDFGLTESYFGLQYKAKTGKFVFKPGLFYHYYDWEIQQFQNDFRKRGKGALLPQLQIDWELNSAYKIKLKYNRLSTFGDASELADRLVLQNFNQLFVGNSNLENELYHRLSLTYSKFSPFKGNFINATLHYTHREQSIRSATAIENIDQISTLIYTDLPENLYSSSVLFTKLLGKYRLKIGSDGNYAAYSRIINEDIQDFTALNYDYQLGGTVQFKNSPTITIDWLHRFSNFKSESDNNKFTIITPSIELEYLFLKDFVLTADYGFTYFQNREQKESNQFSIGNASLLYHQESSPWSVTLEVTNIFDTRFQRENFFSQFLVSDTRTFIQPRVILIKLGYRY